MQPARTARSDFPELEWNGQIAAFAHHRDIIGGDQDAYDTGKTWTNRHTSGTIWTPGDIKFLLDGHLVGESHTAVPNAPADWELQNASILDGSTAALNSWAHIHVTYVKVWSYS